MSEATVYVVDDDASVREALQMLLTVAGYAVETFATGKAFLARAPRGCGCIVLDLRLDDMSGHDVLDALERQGNRLPAVILTAYGDIPAAVRAVRAGAYDFLVKSEDLSSLLVRIGELIEQSRAQQHSSGNHNHLREALDSLSPREREVLNLAAQGLDNQTMAQRLSLSHRTIEAHRSHIARKLGVDSLAEFFRRAATQPARPKR